MKEEIKQRIKAKSEKVKRYQNRINQYNQNRTFVNNQGKFYRDVNNAGDKGENECPDSQEAQAFWNSIWGEKTEHKKDAQWIDDVKENF